MEGQRVFLYLKVKWKSKSTLLLYLKTHIFRPDDQLLHRILAFPIKFLPNTIIFNTDFLWCLKRYLVVDLRREEIFLQIYHTTFHVPLWLSFTFMLYTMRLDGLVNFFCFEKNLCQNNFWGDFWLEDWHTHCCFSFSL